MDPMEATIAAVRASDHPNIASIAREHGVQRSTLSRRCRGETASMAIGSEARRKLSNAQEDALIAWITNQCDHFLPPTAAMVANVARELSHGEVSKNWPSRFVARHRDRLDRRFLHNMDISRHKAENYEAIEQYFELIGQKIEEHQITRENMYNMDEKGFLLGVCQKSQRIISRASYAKKQLITAGQDGSREWITVMATICADGTTIPPGIIYESLGGNIVMDWLQNFGHDLEDDRLRWNRERILEKRVMGRDYLSGGKKYEYSFINEEKGPRSFWFQHMEISKEQAEQLDLDDPETQKKILNGSLSNFLEAIAMDSLRSRGIDPTEFDEYDAPEA